MTTPRVLVVEDDRDTREMVSRFLELEGFDVQTARNGAEALNVLEGGDHTCVILLDLMMPVMDGWQFRRLQQDDPRLSRIPVVVVTAAGPRERIPPIAADGWLAKPLDFDTLLATIERFCQC